MTASAVSCLLVGMVIGAVLLLVVLNHWVNTDEAQRRAALLEAEHRLRDVQTRALREMASAGEQAIVTRTRRGFSDRDVDLAAPPREVIEGEGVDEAMT